MTELTGSVFEGFSLNSEEPEKSEETNVLNFPDKSKPKDRMTASIETLNERFDKKNLKALFAVAVDNEENMDIMICGGIESVKNYLLLASILDSMRHTIIAQASQVIIPGNPNG